MRAKLLPLGLLILLAFPAGSMAHGEADHLDNFKAKQGKGARIASIEEVDSCLSPGGYGRADDSPIPYRFKLVYVSPEQGEDRSGQVARYAQQATDYISLQLARVSGYSKTIRFDSTAECGGRKLDLGSVKLAFDQSGERNAMNSLRAGLSGYMREHPEQNLMLLVDGVNRKDGFLGLGEMRPPEGRQGGRLSAVFLSPQLDSLNMAHTILHEALHNLGAVRDDAPHSTLGGHLFEGYDVMQQGGGGFSGEMDYPCSPSRPILPIDCGGDDYYNPSPEPGSPMADGERNTYLSPFMAGCQEAGCGREQIEGLKIESALVERGRRWARITLSLSGNSLHGEEIGPSLNLSVKLGKSRKWRSPKTASFPQSCQGPTCTIELVQLKPKAHYRAQVILQGKYSSAESAPLVWRQR